MPRKKAKQKDDFVPLVKLKRIVFFEFDTTGEKIGPAATQLQEIIMRFWWAATGPVVETLEMKVPGPGGGNPVWTAKVIYKETYDTLVAHLIAWGLAESEDELKESGAISG